MEDLQLFINDEAVDIGKNELGILLNFTLFDPEKLTASTDTEYSFTFKLPTNDRNNRIFDNANILSKNNKYNRIYKAELVSQSNTIFSGQVLLKSIDDENYSCNLIVKKGCDLDKIFGELTLNELDWYIPFLGAQTINEVNADSGNTQVFFPLVSYGVFQKKPYFTDEVASEYTSKFVIDGYNKWWIESFYPSLSVNETLRKCFEKRGYTVGGDIYTDQHLKNIYMSTNLADEQIPVYNLGNPRIGRIGLTCSLNTSNTSYYTQELEYPYFQASDTYWNYDAVDIYDMMGDGTVTVTDPSYIFDEGEHLIVIPADGFYKIDMSIDTTLNTTGSLTFAQTVFTGRTGGRIEDAMDKRSFTKPAGLNEITPIEIQLVRNYEDTIELIKGKNNKRYINGNPDSGSTEWVTCFPHEDAYASQLPTKKNDLTVRKSLYMEETTSGARRRSSSSQSSGASTRAESSRSSSGQRRNYRPSAYGYYNNDGTIMAYDPAVTDGFICGFTSLLGGTASVRKNGKSWSKSYAEKSYSFYNQTGYTYMDVQDGYRVDTPSTFNANTYNNAPAGYFNISGNKMIGSISCMVYLKRNDVLQLMEVHRHLETVNGADVPYNSTSNVSLTITAASPKDYDTLVSDGFGYYSNSQFDYDLRLSNFLNKEKKVSEFVNDVVRALNLEIVENGNNIFINKKRRTYTNTLAFIDLDDKAAPEDATTSMIDFPRTMAMKWNIDTEEWGFEDSVPYPYINQEDWADYGDYGYEVINLGTNAFNDTDEEVTVPFSYTWYSNFDIDSGSTISIPVISKYTWMIDGYDYEESAKHDGYGLRQRFWYRDYDGTGHHLTLSSYPTETVEVYTPKRSYLNMALSYKLSEKSILSQYFNVKPLISSNYLEVDVYLSTEEYNALKAGATVKFDNDKYYPVSISNFDPTGQRTTKLKLMKS